MGTRHVTPRPRHVPHAQGQLSELLLKFCGDTFPDFPDHLDYSSFSQCHSVTLLLEGLWVGVDCRKERKAWHRCFFVPPAWEQEALHVWRQLAAIGDLVHVLTCGSLVVKRYDQPKHPAGSTARLAYVFAGVTATPIKGSKNPGFARVSCQRVYNGAGCELGRGVVIKALTP